MAGKAVANGFVHAWTSCCACPITGPMPRPRGSWCSEQTALAHGLRTLAAATGWRTQRMHGGISGGMGPRRHCHGLAPSDLSAASRRKQATKRAQAATTTCWQAAAQKRPRHARKWRLGHQGGVGWPEVTRSEVLGATRGWNRRRRPVTTGAGDGEFFSPCAIMGRGAGRVRVVDQVNGSDPIRIAIELAFCFNHFPMHRKQIKSKEIARGL
jgi:hypothetical protein